MSDVARLHFLFRYLPFVALVYLGAHLYGSDLVSLDLQRLRIMPLLLSMLLLFLTFLMQAGLWFRFLRSIGVAIDLREALASQFCQVPAKYLPGKVWAAFGTAGLISDRTASFRQAMLAVLWFQLALTGGGLLLGGAGMLLLMPLDRHWMILVLAMSLLAAVVYLLRRTRFAHRLYRHLGGPEGFMGRSLLRAVARALLGCCGLWAVIGFAYVLLIQSLGYDAGLYPVLLQPLANNLGLLAVLAPGGLGVREAVMAMYLALAGLTGKEALQIALYARLWFVVVELIVFLIGIMAARRHSVGTGR